MIPRVRRLQAAGRGASTAPLADREDGGHTVGGLAPPLKTLAALLALLLAAPPASAAEVDEAAETLEFFAEEAQVYAAGRRAQPASQAPADVVVITADELYETGARTLADALSLLPGVQLTGHRKGGQNVWFRGVTSGYNDKTVLLIDGLPFKEVVYGQHPVDEHLPLDDVQRIEVVRGPASALFGANALGGVINLVTKEPKDVPRPEVAAGFGSWNTQSHSALWGSESERGGAVFSASYFDTKGSRHDRDEDGNATTRRDPRRRTAGGVRLRRGDFRLSARYSEYRISDVTNSDLKPRTHDRRTALTGLEWNRAFGEALTLSVRGHFNYFDWPSRRRTFQADGVTLKNVQDTEERTQAAGAGLLAQARWLPGHRMLLGLEFENERGLLIERHTWTTTAANPAPALTRFTAPNRPDVTNAALLFEDEWSPRPSLSLTAGVRYDRQDHYGGQYSPRAAFNVRPAADWTFKLLYGEAFRAPSFRELYVREVPAEDDGNPDLRAERLRTLEALAVHRPGPWEWRLALYRNELRDFIAPDKSLLKYTNQGTYCIYGAEPGLRFRAVDSWDAFLNYTLLRARDSAGNDMPELAKELLNLGATARPGRWLTLHARLHHVGRRSRPPGYQSAVAAQNRTDLLGAYQTVNLAVTTRGLPAEVSLAVHNLFDVRSFNPSFYRGEFDVQHPGRSMLLRLRWAF